MTVVDGTKHCWGCDEVLSVELFHRDRGKKDGYQSKCKKCQYARYQERLAEDPTKVRAIAAASQRKHRKRRLYGLTNEAFEQLRQKQNGRCACCRRDVEVLVVDHCHGTGRIRGLLCHNCNRGLGLLGDDLVSLQAAVAYLRLDE